MWLVHAGNRIDAPDRTTPRFPATNVAAVEDRLAKFLGALRPDGVVSAAASGADLLVLDAAVQLRIPIHVSLPLRVEEFRERSVADQGASWVMRFERVLKAAGWREGTDEGEHLSVTDVAGHDDWYLRGNDVILDDAAAVANGTAVLAIVIRPVPDGAGTPSATDDFATKAAGRGLTVIDVDPLVTRRKVAFVVMPYGTKPDRGDATTTIDFDETYRKLYVPLLEDADVDWRRADKASESGFVHTAMFDDLCNADLAIADLTFGNGNVLYEVGMRHALRAKATVLVNRKGSERLFDTQPLRTFTYELAGPKMTDAEAVAAIAALQPIVATALDGHRVDSPVHELFEVTSQLTLVARAGKAGTIDRSHTIAAMLDGIERTSRVRDAHALADDDVERVLACADDVRALDDGGANADALAYRIGSLLRTFGRYAEALGVLGQIAVAADHPGFATLRKEQAMCHRRLGEAAAKAGGDSAAEFDRAERLLDESLGAAVPDADAFGVAGGLAKRRAEAALVAGDDAAARRFLRGAAKRYAQGLDRAPTDYYLHLNAVTCERILGTRFGDAAALAAARERLPVAQYFARRAADANPDDVYAVASVGELAYTAFVLDGDDGAQAEALRRYQRVGDLEPPADRLAAIHDQLRIYGRIDPQHEDLLDHLTEVATPV